MLIQSESLAITVTRGPYLQNQSPQEITIKWRTDIPTDSVVYWGKEVNHLNQVISNLSLTNDHELTINNLIIEAQFYYAIGNSSQILAGDDSSHYFNVPPIHGSQKPFSFWVLGDSGTANNDAAAVRDAYYQYAQNKTTNLWFMLGDNAYATGDDLQYQAAVFDMYPDLLKQSTLWPVIGNHDAGSANSIAETGVYYDIFAVPNQAHTSGHSTGADSGSEAYYSFDYANVHFIILESVETSASFRTAMEWWLASDLSISQADWTVALWHHPPYTKGSHDSDLEPRHIYMRENILPILENEGVDLILGGHSHSYERSWLIDGQYGISDSFDVNTQVSDGSEGHPILGEAYIKQSLGSTSHDGTVYVVAGSSGKTGLVNPTAHEALRNKLALPELGSLVVEVSGHSLTVKFLKDNGEIEDMFLMVKGDLIFADDFE